jgi:hypothetical protein
MKCPRCGYRVIIDTLTSNPPQYEAYCSHYERDEQGCSFTLRVFERIDRYAEITQEELDVHQ